MRWRMRLRMKWRMIDDEVGEDEEEDEVDDEVFASERSETSHANRPGTQRHGAEPQSYGIGLSLIFMGNGLGLSLTDLA